MLVYRKSIMQTNGQKIWFPAKKYGWGWGAPCAWQGWVVMALWLALLVAGGILLAPRSVGLYLVYAFSLALVLIAVAFAKGEKPRWRWGDDDTTQPKSTADRLTQLEELRSRNLISDSEYQAKRRELLKDL